MNHRSLLRFWPALIPLALGATMVGLVVHYELLPTSATHVGEPFTWTRHDRDALLGVLCAVAGLGLVAYALLRRFAFARRTWFQGVVGAVLTLLCLASGLVYFYGARGERATYVHVHDSYHYLLGAKYFPELGYDGLYECTVEALPRTFFLDKTQMRNLTTDRSLTVKDFRGKTHCRDRFTNPARWEEFVHDVTVYGDASKSQLRGSLRDRGYNGSPFHTFVAKAVADAFTIDYGTLSLAHLIDVVPMCLMLAFVPVVFGWRLGLVFLLFAFTQFCDRHVFIGNSFVRYWWWVALAGAFLALHRKRYLAAGVLMAISTAMNVFPVVFAGGVVAKVVTQLARRRPVDPHHVTFLKGAIAAGVLCLALGTAHSNGLRNYAQFADAMKTHNVAFRLQNFGVGLKYDFVYRGEIDKESYSYRKKSNEFRAMRPLFVSLALAFILLAAAIATRLDDVEAAVLVGFTAMFCYFGPSTYYYACAPLLLLLWHRRAWDTGGLAMIILLFGLTVIPHSQLYQNRWEAFLFNTLASAVFSVYLLVTFGYLGTTTGLFRDGLALVRKKRAKAEGPAPGESAVSG